MALLSIMLSIVLMAIIVVLLVARQRRYNADRDARARYMSNPMNDTNMLDLSSNTFRHHSMISAVVNGVVMGFGAMSYIMAVRGVVEIARETETHG